MLGDIMMPQTDDWVTRNRPGKREQEADFVSVEEGEAAIATAAAVYAAAAAAGGWAPGGAAFSGGGEGLTD